jgi:hypothetical protein
MLIEVKTKVSRTVDNKIRKRLETYLIDKSFFSEAEYAVTARLTEEQQSHLAESFEIQSLRISPIKEVYTGYQGEQTFIATLKDIFLADDGTEKATRYKVLLWANSLTEANSYVQQLVHQGYEMQVESLKQVDYEYLTEEEEDESR